MHTAKSRSHQRFQACCIDPARAVNPAQLEWDTYCCFRVRPAHSMQLDPAALTLWLDALKQQPVETAITSLDDALEQFADAGLPAAQLAALLERLRLALPGQIARLAKAWYADRPLPLAPPERAMLTAMQALFGKLSDLYWLCCQQFEREPESEMRNQNLAAPLQRCVHALVSRMIEDYRARQVIAPGVWLELHRVIDKANALGVDKISIPDELNPNSVSAINVTYGRIVLLASAQAGAMTPRNLDATLALTGLLEPFIECTWQAGDAAAESRVHATGRMRVLHAAGATHLLNNTRLNGALLACSQKLAAGEAVASLDVLPISRPELGGLLVRLHKVWCGIGEIRGEARARADEPAQVASGLYAIYRLASGADFAEPREFHVYAAGARPGAEGAARRSELAGTGEAAQWRVLDRSGEGLRASRSIEGGRLSRACLMGFRIETARPKEGSTVQRAAARQVDFSLGEVRWVQEDAAGYAPAISAGIKLLPGQVFTAVMRGHGGRDGSLYQEVAPAFLLEQAAAPKLIVPNGWWKPDRVVDVWRNGIITRMRMTELLIRGTDFEAGRFTVEKPEKAAAR